MRVCACMRMCVCVGVGGGRMGVAQILKSYVNGLFLCCGKRDKSHKYKQPQDPRRRGVPPIGGIQGRLPGGGEH